jgi:hypothetical protein
MYCSTLEVTFILCHLEPPGKGTYLAGCKVEEDGYTKIKHSSHLNMEAESSIKPTSI